MEEKQLVADRGNRRVRKIVELKTIEEEAIQAKAEPEIVKKETETVRDLPERLSERQEYCSWNSWKGDLQGATVDQIASDMEYENVSFPVLKTSIGNMMRAGTLTEVSRVSPRSLQL